MRIITLSLLLLTFVIVQDASGQLESWRRKIAGPVLTVGINPRNPSTVYAQVGGPNLSVSYDRGKTWSFLGNPQLSQIRQILVHPSDTSVIFCAAFLGGIRRSQDNGFTWITVLSDFGIDGESISYDPIHPDTMYAGNFYDGNVFRSTNRGLTWNQMGTSSSLMCALAVRPDSSNIILAGTGDGRISKSTDSGTTWRLVKEGGSQEIPRIVISASEPMTLYGTGYAGPDNTTGIWKSTDGGEHWDQTSLHASVWAVDVDNTNANVVYAGTFNVDDAAIYRTTDGGNTWTSLIHGFPGNGDAWSIKVHPTDPSMVWLALSSSSESGIHRWQTTNTILEGAVLDAATGDTVMSGSLRVTQTGDSVLLGNTGGRFRFGYFDGDLTLQPSIRSLAYPYFISTHQITFTPGATETQNILVQRLPQSSINGSVRDLSHQPVEAILTLTSTGTNGASQYVTTTNPDGSFEFNGLYITHPPIVQYQQLAIGSVFPFRNTFVTPISLDSSGLLIDASVDTADVLVAGPQAAGNVLPVFREALDANGITYHTWNGSDTAPLGLAGLTKKKVVLYSTGLIDSAITVSELESLKVCLDGGSNLFLTGRNLVELNDSTDFMLNYAHVAFAGNSSLSAARGTIGDIFANTVISPLPPPRDSMFSTSDLAHPVFRYAAAFQNLGTAAVRVDTANGRGRLILFGFPFEAIFSAPQRRNILMVATGYLEGSIVVGVDDLSNELPGEFRLHQNYPNPFNPSTVIQFVLPAKGHTTLRVFDILGREIQTLVNKPMEPGSHTVTLDGANLPSGVYFYTLNSGGRMNTRKMLLLK